MLQEVKTLEKLSYGPTLHMIGDRNIFIKNTLDMKVRGLDKRSVLKDSEDQDKSCDRESTIP